MLTRRRTEILGLVVHQYIDTAAPVSSRALVSRHGLSISTATIRNELAKLEEDGYIAQPHTSAGRVPLDRGYRLYVEELMAEEPIGVDEQRTIEHQFHQAPAHLEEWLSLAAHVLATAVSNVAVITRPTNRVAQLRQVQLVHLHDETALLVAVMDDGRVQQRMVLLSRSEDQDGLTARAMRLNARIANAEAATVRAVAEELTDEDDRRLAEVAAELIDEHRVAGETYLEGLRSALEQPEFASAERMLDAVRHLQAYELLRALPTPEELRPGATRVMIGSENSDDWMHEWSVVTSSFGDYNGSLGTIAVLGPTRMRYGYTIPRVRYVASLVTALLQGMSR
ncbi:MAG: heat-inducible transcriptional repressor HrcA [Dehalococcoidia bacterium]|nr:heat-inducible transcriptional repressor HrcA [Dehalococcoidia bacterium]